jgi:anoctamin-10
MSKNEGLGPASPPRIPGFTRLSSHIYNLKFALIESSSSSSSPEMAKSQALQSNLDVDYVVSYRFAKTGMCMAAAGEACAGCVG